MEVGPPSANEVSAKSSFACIRCSERKVRCNKQIPCDACTRHNVQCIYRAPKPPRRGRKSVKSESLHDRLKLYEALLEDKGINPKQAIETATNVNAHPTSTSDAAGSTTQLPTPSSTTTETQGTIFKPQLLHGQTGTKLVDNNLWSRVAEEIDDADMMEDDSANDTSDGISDFGYVLGQSMPTKISHPPAKHVHYLWQAFIQNVNPVTKVVHIPTLQPAIDKAINDIDRVPRGFEALMFAIYSIAVLSLAEDKCEQRLGQSKAVLFRQYVTATKRALSRSKFMSSTSLVVLQALILHIFSIREISEPRAIWSLTGVAIRIAENMGMRLDGTLLGLSPFETEIRRRVWWQLSFHDFRAAELSGQDKIRTFGFDETSPKRPANVDDVDLYPTMPQPAVDSARPTEMIWIMMRADLAAFAGSMKAKFSGKFTSEEFAAMDDLKMKDRFSQELEETLETKHLRFCDPTEPLHLWTMVGARLSISMGKFLGHHPRRWKHLDHVPASEQKFVWNIALQLLGHYNMMQTNPLLNRFAWGIGYFIQWQAVIHILDTLRAEPHHPDAAKAWRLIDALYEYNSAVLLNIDRAIFAAIGSLCLKAFDARPVASKEGQTPEYIVKLRKSREAAKARRIAVRNKKADEKRSTMQERDIHTGTAHDGNLQPLADINGDDAFWLNDAMNDGSFAGMMNMDADTMLAQDWLDTPNGENLDWTQWDNWFGSVAPGLAAK